ncbi:MAG: hypothetical protein LH649_08520 [Pseudanabaena sp. CAN_BIN31]|nr:hypothetical protein [Pseudanabaena sp. CAN_BIN31]
MSKSTQIILPSLNELLGILGLSINFDSNELFVLSKPSSSEIAILDIQKNLDCISDEVTIDQNYRLSKKCQDKNIKLILSVDRLFYTKFDRIIINEYFYSLKESSYLMIITRSDFPNSVQYLKKVLSEEYKGVFRFVNSAKVNSCEIAIFQKTEFKRVVEGDIKKWTFGFIGNGKRDQFISEQIECIKKLPLKEWEVIICGTYNLPIIDENITYIPFTENDDKGWITKKKNLIAQAASNENLIILHDRYFIPDNFVEKMEEWGNDFELLGAKQILYRSPLRIYKARIQDWMMSPFAVHIDKDTRWKFSYFFLDYNDWDILAYIPGGIFIVKRSLMLRIPQDEQMFWNSPEDIKFCQDFAASGYCLRINTLLEFETASFAHPCEDVPLRVVNTKRYLCEVNNVVSPLYIYERFLEKLLPNYVELKYKIETTNALRIIFGDEIPCYIFHAHPIDNIKSVGDLSLWYHRLLTIDRVRLVFSIMSIEDKIKTMQKLILRRSMSDDSVLAVIIDSFKTVHFFDERAVIQSLLDTGEVERRLVNMSVPDYPLEAASRSSLAFKVAFTSKPIAIFIIKVFYRYPRIYRFISNSAKLFLKPMVF